MINWQAQKNTGFIQDSFDPRDWWLDEIEELAGTVGEDDLPKSFVIGDLPFDYQAGFPFCVSYATTTMLEHIWGKRIALSQPHLFFHAGGSKNGSTFRNNLNIAQNKGCLKEARMMRPVTKTANWYEDLKDAAMAIPFTNTFKLSGYARVSTDWEKLKQALYKYKVPILVGVSVSQTPGNSYWDADHTRVKNTDNHGVLLVGWKEDGSPIIFDSLKGWADFDGYHTFAPGYQFFSAYQGLPTLPEEPEVIIEKIEEKKKEEFETVLNHYGKVRNFSKELEVAAELRKQFEDFKNQSVLEAAGKFWTVYINAVCYGGYSYKDVINDCYNWRRTGKHAFNLNNIRK